MTDNKSRDDRFDRLLADVNTQALDDATAEAAVDRVWQRIAGAVADEPSALATCEDYQSLVPPLVRGELPEARALLVQDHTRECVPCRRALMAERSGRVNAAAAPRRAAGQWRVPRILKLAAAAVLAAGLTITGYMTGANYMADRSLTAAVEDVHGNLQLVSGSNSRNLSTGDALRSHQTIRTAKASGAFVALADGSVIEMAPRSELELHASRKGTTIDLARGNIIVHAAEQHGGRLFVATDECLVAVKGTIFAVNHGLKGSRVSVIEGEVEVQHGPNSALLNPGDQMTTDERLDQVAVEDEIAWSLNADEHRALLGELRQLQRELGKAVDVAEARTSTRLLDLCADDTLIYAGIPNLTEGLVAAREVFDARLAESPVLGAWWDENVVATGIDDQIDAVLNRLQPLGEAVGDEVVVSVPAAAIADQAGPQVMAVLADPAGFSALLAEEVERLNAESPDEVSLVIVDDPMAVTGTDGEIYLWVVNDLFAAAPDISQLRHLSNLLAGGTTSGFIGSELHSRLAESYSGGVEWLFGVDMSSVIEEAAAAEGDEGSEDLEVMRELGLLDASTLVVERQTDGEVATTEAALDFDGPRRGMAAWLAPPAPMGSLDFISSEASMAGAIVAKDAAVIFDELLSTMANFDADAVAELEAFEAEHGFDLRADLAATLGGEAAFAVDGPLVPTPSWKLIVEVYDPATLHFTIERAIAEINRSLIEQGEDEIVLETSMANGLEYRSLSQSQIGTGMVYTVVDGYLVAAPSQALIEQSLRFRETGQTLPNSADFRDLLPQNGYTDCSALSFRNLGGLADAIPAGALSGLPVETAAIIEEGVAPSLYCVYGESDRIIMSGTGGSLIGLTPLMGLPSLLGATALADELTTGGADEVSS